MTFVFFSLWIYYLLAVIALVKDKYKYGQFLGPLLFLSPSMYDKKSRRLIFYAFLYLALFLLSSASFVILGESWPR